MKAKEGILDLLNRVLTANLTAINQYFVHAKMCENWGYDRLHNHVRKRSFDEMKDAEEILEDMQKDTDGHIDWIEKQLELIKQISLEQYLSEQIHEKKS